MTPRKVNKKLDMMAEFGHLTPAGQRRLLLLAESTLDESRSPEAHFLLISQCEAEARVSLTREEGEREFQFCRRWMANVPSVRRLLLQATSN